MSPKGLCCPEVPSLTARCGGHESRSGVTLEA